MKTKMFDSFAGGLHLGCLASSVESIEYIIGEEVYQVPAALIVVTTVGEESVISNRAGRAAWPASATDITVSFNAVEAAQVK